MSVKVVYRNGAFEPLEDFTGAEPRKVYTVFSDEELRDGREVFDWLRTAQKNLNFWDNRADAVYDEQ